MKMEFDDMKRMIIDLDILTNAFWKGENKERAKKFLDSIAKDDVEILTPSTLLDLIFEWKDRKLAKSILSFYSENSDILSQKTILRKFEASKINYKVVIDRLTKISVKEEDSFMVLVAAAFELCITTFNKKHLLGKKGEINAILREFNLKEVEIDEPI